jgi:hypothetical protein
VGPALQRTERQEGRVEVLIADLDKEGSELSVEPARWGLLLETLQSMNLLGEETRHRMASPAATVEVSEEEARRMGRHLQRRILLELDQKWVPPEIPSYIVPIATSNGLWIDPALPLMEPPEIPCLSLIKFAGFCLDCKGFSIH